MTFYAYGFALEIDTRHDNGFRNNKALTGSATNDDDSGPRDAAIIAKLN